MCGGAVKTAIGSDIREDGNSALQKILHRQNNGCHSGISVPLEDQGALISVLQTGAPSRPAAMDKTVVNRKRFLRLEEEKDEQET
jgi:hypothetical protein